MSILHPAWLLLLLPAGILLYTFRPPTRTLQLLRAAAITLVIVAMSALSLRLPGRSGTVVVVADRSESMEPAALRNQEEVINLIAGAMDARERLAVVAFGRETTVEHAPQAGAFAGFTARLDTDQSNMARAIEKGLDLIPRDGVGRLLVLSDGRWTGSDPVSAAGHAASRNIAIDFRHQAKPIVQDLAIDRIAQPQRLAAGEAFMLTAWVRSPVRQEVTYELVRGNRRLAAGKRHMAAGMNRLIFRDVADSAGVQQYVLRVEGGPEDSQPENNRARILVGVSGTRPVLCVSGTERGAFPKLLRRGALNVQTVRPSAARWSLASLAKYSSVVLENVPATDIGASGMELLAAWVESAGSGLMMTGGRNAYAPGGYFGSPIERILPVSMELKKEHRKFSLALVVVMDRSGSMGASAGMGKTKMDLANIGAVQVMDLLSDDDEFGVIAVDSAAHTVTDIAPVAVNRAERDHILSVQSMGGGIFVYEALAAATRMLLQAQSHTRHIILFADAADAEEPGKYVELLAKGRDANITCSVIGLGSDTDCDAELLRDVARMGSGQCLFAADAMEIPRLFAQDTFAVTRSALVEEPTAVAFTPGYSLLAGSPLKEQPVVGGYNLCYVRPEANLAAVTTDEYQAPVIASWQAGRGRVVCYTGEADGEFTGDIAKWPRVGTMFSSLVRWAAGSDSSLPPGMMLVQRSRDGICRLELHLDPKRTGVPFHGAPEATILHGEPGSTPERAVLPLTWESADLLAAEFPLHGTETTLPNVTVPGQAAVTLSPVCLPYSPEYRPAEAGRGIATLRRIADISGGQERADVTALWRSLPTQARLISVAPWLYGLAILILLVDVLQRRTGILARRTGASSRPTSFAWRRASKPATPPQKKQTQPRRPHPKHPAPPQANGAADTKDSVSAFEKARRRARGRTSR